MTTINIAASVTQNHGYPHQRFHRPIGSLPATDHRHMFPGAYATFARAYAHLDESIRPICFVFASRLCGGTQKSYCLRPESASVSDRNPRPADPLVAPRTPFHLDFASPFAALSGTFGRTQHQYHSRIALERPIPEVRALENTARLGDKTGTGTGTRPTSIPGTSNGGPPHRRVSLGRSLSARNMTSSMEEEMKREWIVSQFETCGLR